MAEEAIRIAIVGAESTGKTTLARLLAQRIAAETGLRCTWVGEYLREWCDRERRTPLVGEQEAIARAQQQRIDAAALGHELVVCDTTALMTAVYSRYVFGDRSLETYAVQAHRTSRITLLTALDLPWTPDGLQRDGEHVRQPVDAAIRELLAAHRLPWTRVTGSGPARIDSAFAAVRSALGWAQPEDLTAAAPTTAALRGRG